MCEIKYYIVIILLISLTLVERKYYRDRVFIVFLIQITYVHVDLPYLNIVFVRLLATRPAF